MRLTAQSKRFFELPLETKQKFSLTSASVNQGYTSFGMEGDGRLKMGQKDPKESYEHRRYSNEAPSDEELQGFRAAMDAFYAKCFTLSVEVLRCLAIVLKLGVDYFDSIMDGADPQLRILHYPPIPRREIDETRPRISAHTDFGLCTLLFQDSVGGLEVDPHNTGIYTPAIPREGTVLINVGDLLQLLTNGRARSTYHRVMTPPSHSNAPDEMLPARYSIPFFVHPHHSTIVKPIVLDGERPKFEEVNAGEWRTRITSLNYAAPPQPAGVASTS